MLAVRQNFGTLSRLELDYDNNKVRGTDDNTAAKLEAQYGWKVGQDAMYLTVNRSPSWTGGVRRDNKGYASFNVSPPDGKPSMYINYNGIGPNFVSSLGYVPEENIRGYSAGMEQTNKFDKGKLAGYDIEFDTATYQYYTGGFYRSMVSPYGLNVYFAYSQRARSGMDIFLLLGDPNSLKSRGIVTLKIVRPF